MRVRSVAAVPCVLVLSIASACNRGDPATSMVPPAVPPPEGPFQWPRERDPGVVRAIAIGDGGTVYVGGTFSHIGPMTGGGAPVHAGDGAPAAFPRVDGIVHAAEPDGVGGWYVGGEFERVGGAPRANLAHVLADGSLDAAWSPGASVSYPSRPGHHGAVTSLAFDGAILYVAGAFDTLGGEARRGVGAVDAAGRVTSWAPAVEPASSVRALAVRGSTVYVGGDFTAVDGEARASVAAVDATGALMPWDPGAASLRGSLFVSALAIAGDTVYLGGLFGVLDGEMRSLAAVDAATGEATAWRPELGWAIQPGQTFVNCLALDGGTLYVGGLFETADGETRSGIAAFDASGALTPWAPALDSVDVFAIAVSGGVVYVGGAFDFAGGQARSRVAAFDASGAPTAWDPHVDGAGRVYALAASGGAVYVGGSFRWLGKETKRPGLAAIDPSGRVTAWNPGVAVDPGADAMRGPAVYALAVVEGTIYVGGDFTSIGGAARRNLAAVDASGAVGAFAADANGPVFALAPRAGLLHVAGDFGSVGGVPRTYLAAVDPSGKVTPWDPRPNAPVTTLAEGGGTLYAGGFFTGIGAEPRAALAGFDGSGALLPWSGSPTWVTGEWSVTGVWSIAVDGSTLYVAGDFCRGRGSRLDPVRCWQLTAVDAVSGAASSIEFPEHIEGGRVRAVGIRPGPRSLVVGGSFGARSVDGLSSVPSVALVDPGTWASSGAWLETMVSELPGFDPMGAPRTEAIAIGGGVTYVGGSFWGSGLIPPRRFGLAAFGADENLTTWDPNVFP